MDEDSITRMIVDTFEGVEIASVDGVTFYFFDPEQKFPFATLVTRDNAYDNFSNLDRPGVFRLNVGVGKATFQAMFGSPDEERDFTALDRFMPHPVYGRQYWVSVLNPSAETFEVVLPMLAEAYGMSVARQAKREERT